VAVLGRLVGRDRRHPRRWCCRRARVGMG
jgi:hypothetical protein